MKNKILLTPVLCFYSILGFAQSVGIGTTTPDSTAKLELQSTTQGFLPPRMTTAKRDSIANPASGLLIYSTSQNLLQYYNGSGWVNMGSLSSTNPTSNCDNPFIAKQLGATIYGPQYGQMGHSVSLSQDGQRMAVGIPGSGAGIVQIFDWNGTSWVQFGTDIIGESSSDRSGFSVSLAANGNRIAIGAPRNSNSNGTLSGHVRIYEWNNTAWVQLGQDLDGEASSDQSGGSVSISSDGSRVIIGAGFNDGGASNSGHVRVYELNAGNWVLIGEIDGLAANSRAGTSVSISGDGNTIAFGAPYQPGSPIPVSSVGLVRMYKWVASSWQPLGTGLYGSSSTSGQYGFSVDLNADGTTLVIGADRHNEVITLNGPTSYPLTQAGKLQVYDWDGSNWNQIGQNIFGEESYTRLGSSVSISDDGRRIAAGGTFYQGPNTTTGTGITQFFELIDNHWAKQGSNIIGEIQSGVTNIQNGWSVSLSGDGKRLATGSPLSPKYTAPTLPQGAGSVRVYK